MIVVDARCDFGTPVRSGRHTASRIRYEIFIKYANEGENYFSYIIVIISRLTSAHRCGGGGGGGGDGS